MRPNVIVAKKGEAPARMICAVTGKPVQSGATAVSLSEYAWCYVNPGKELTDKRRAELLTLAADYAPKAQTNKKSEGDK